MELEAHPLATVIVKINSGKNHQCGLIVREVKLNEEEDIYIVSKYLPTKILTNYINYKGERVTLPWKRLVP